ncbi:MAG: DUF4129 domain-containing protein [Firmicutes bacterium]|nr:DUF4129 domain-containing protein [Bacillota bacterium]
MKKLTVILHDLAGVYLYSYPFFAVAAFALLKEEWSIAELLRLHTLIWVPGYLYAVRQKAKGKWLRIVLHFCIFIGALAYSGSSEPGDFMTIFVLLLAFFIFSLMLFSADMILETSAGALGFFGCLLFILYMVVKGPELKGYFVFASIILLLLYLADMHFFNMNRTLENSQQILRQDIHGIKRRNYIIFMGTLLVMALGTLAVLGLGVDKILGVWFERIFGWIGRLFSQEGKESEQEVTDPLQFNDLPWGLSESAGMSQGGGNAILITLAVAAVVVVILLIIKYWRGTAQEEELDYYEEKSSFSERKGRVSRMHRFWAKSNGERIRQVYRQWVERLAEQGMRLRRSDTAGQINERVEEISFDEMTRLFEKARYSEETITETDLDRMKRSAETLKIKR